MFFFKTMVKVTLVRWWKNSSKVTLGGWLSFSINDVLISKNIYLKRKWETHYYIREIETFWKKYPRNSGFWAVQCSLFLWWFVNENVFQNEPCSKHISNIILTLSSKDACAVPMAILSRKYVYKQRFNLADLRHNL